METNKTINLEVKGALEVELGSVVSSNNVEVSIPTIIQTSGLPQDDALAFIKDCAEGKRKIAKAVRNKYETITEEESGITEYSTFEELSNKISDIPIEVPLGSAMEQNGGVLPFYDVYNELVKASKQYTEYPYSCAMGLDKWDYDNDHKITLSGADAYLTSDGVYLRSSEVNGEYQFTDQDKPNSNRFVVYFFGSTPYQVPKSLPATSVFGLWCLKGTPLMNFNADFTQLNSINVYDGELVVNSEADFKFSGISRNNTLYLPHIKELNVSTASFNNLNTYIISLPNLRKTNCGNMFVALNYITNITLPSLEYVYVRTNSYMFNYINNCKSLNLPKLETIKLQSSAQCSLIYNSSALLLINLPSLNNAITGIMSSTACKQGCKIILGKPVGGNIRILTSGTNSKIEIITVEKGFASKLNLTGCNGLSREVLVDILNNLADLTDTEYADKLQLILGATLYNKLTAEDVLIATNKHWLVS